MHCIALLGGIPGCGKTELLHYILSNRQSLFRSVLGAGDAADEHFANTYVDIDVSPLILVISFDELCSLEDQAKIAQTVNGWKNFRVQLLEAAERYICDICSIECNLQGPLSSRSQELLEKLRSLNVSMNHGQAKESDVIFLIEDNFYYRSMRYEWFQIARREGLGFCHVYLTCPVEVALERNSSRGYNIPEYRIRMMFSLMEYPEPKKYKWENFSMLYDTVGEMNHSRVLPIIELFVIAMREPAQMVMQKDKIEAQAVCSKSVIHQTDKVLRKITGEVIQNLQGKENHHACSGDIQQIVSTRQKLLLELKQGSVCLPQDITNAIENCGVSDSSIIDKLEVTLRHLLLERCTHSPHSTTQKL